VSTVLEVKAVPIVDGSPLPGRWPGSRGCAAVRLLDGAAHGAEDLAHLGAQEDQGDDRHDGDEGEDQRVLRETLAVLVVSIENHEDSRDEGHVERCLPIGSPRPSGGGFETNLMWRLRTCV
jgi:hypothetical protein